MIIMINQPSSYGGSPISRNHQDEAGMSSMSPTAEVPEAGKKIHWENAGKPQTKNAKKKREELPSRGIQK